MEDCLLILPSPNLEAFNYKVITLPTELTGKTTPIPLYLVLTPMLVVLIMQIFQETFKNKLWGV